MKAQRSSLWKFLRVTMRKTLPFKKALYFNKKDCKVKGDTITKLNQAIETKTKTVNFKTTQGQMPESCINQVQH